MEVTEQLRVVPTLVELYQGRGDWVGCVRTLVRAAQLSETPTSKVDWLARAAKIEVEHRHDRESAKVLYDQVLGFKPDHEEALKFAAEHLTSADGQSLQDFERLEPFMAQRDDLDDFDTRLEVASFYFKLAQALLAADRVDDAIARFERALELNTGHLPTLQAVAPLYRGRSDWKNAQRVLRQILQLTGGQGEPEQVAQTYTELGLVERALGHQDKAQKRFTKALETVQNHVGALKGMALILEDREDWTNLLNVYNNIIYRAESAEDVISAYVIKGRILDEKLNRPDKAASHYEGGLAIEPNQPRVVLRLAELSFRKEEWREAIAVLERGLALPIQGALRGELLLLRAAAEAAQGQEALSKQTFEQAKHEDPECAVRSLDPESVRAFLLSRLSQESVRA